MTSVKISLAPDIEWIVPAGARVSSLFALFAWDLISPLTLQNNAPFTCRIHKGHASFNPPTLELIAQVYGAHLQNDCFDDSRVCLLPAVHTRRIIIAIESSKDRKT